MTLSDLQVNESAWVEKVHAGAFGEGLASRLEAMGFVHDKQVTMIRKAIMGGPVEVRVGRTTVVAIRRNEAALVFIRRDLASVN